MDCGNQSAGATLASTLQNARRVTAMRHTETDKHMQKALMYQAAEIAFLEAQDEKSFSPPVAGPAPRSTQPHSCENISDTVPFEQNFAAERLMHRRLNVLPGFFGTQDQIQYSASVDEQPEAWAESLLEKEAESTVNAINEASTDDVSIKHAAQQMVTSTSATSVATSTFSQESSTLHEDLENSQFMQLMQQLANGQLSVVDGKLQQNDQPQRTEYSAFEGKDTSLQKVGADQVAQTQIYYGENNSQQTTSNLDEVNEDNVSGISKQSQAIDISTEEVDTMMEQFMKAFSEDNDRPYQFESVISQTEMQSPDKTASDYLEIGKHALKYGDLSTAILNFELACQLDPSLADAWEILGTSRAENEQDDMAISALKRALVLGPTRRSVLLSLSTSYANEMQLEPAYDTLEAVVRLDERFSSVLPQNIGEDRQTIFFQEQRHDQVVDLYHRAIKLCSEVDPDLQIGLGILQHMSGNYNRAIDCFELALSKRPNDFQLWNKLGASLANGDRSAEAVDVYRRAIELRPGFIRGMYNIGISCINLKAYEQAVEHFLTALQLQSSNNQTSTTMSQTIWHSLRMALMILEKYDLASLTFQQDVSLFKGHFTF
eukprot:gene2736-5607_t